LRAPTPAGSKLCRKQQSNRYFLRFDRELRREIAEQVFDARREIAVLVDRIDQRGDDLAIAQRKIEHRQLREQMVAQRVRRHLLRIEAVVVVIPA
jgi:hypothetical protein